MTVSTPTGLLVDFMPGAGPFDVAGDFYLLVPTGVSGADGNASTPDHASLDITGDIDIRIEITLDDWSPTSTRWLVSKYVSSGDQRSYLFYLNTSGSLGFQWSTDGTSPGLLFATSTVSLAETTVGRLALRVTLDVDDGGGNRVVNFYTAPTIDGAWTQLGATGTTAGTTSIFSGSAVLEVGNTLNNGSTGLGGRVHAAEVRSVIGGTIVANPDFSTQPPGTTSFADSTGKTWTVGSPATIAGFDWVSLTNRLIGKTSWDIGRTNELSPFPSCPADLLLKNDDRQLDPEYTAGTWFGKLNPRTPFRIRSTSSALDLPGSGGATASTPDTGAFAVTDLDVRIRLAMDDWTPGGFGQFLIGQWPNVGGNNGWVLSMNTSGQPALTWTADGTTGITRTSSAATGFTDGSEHWLRVTLDVDNGAAGHTVVFYTSTDGYTWTQLGTTSITAGVTSIFNSTAVLAIGDILVLAGTVKQAEVRSVIGGTIVANPDFSAQRPGATTFTDRSGRVWTVNGTAVIANDTANPQDEYYGFVENGFKQIYSPPKQCDCAVHLVDMIGVLNGSPLPSSAYEGEVLFDNPGALWRLDETTGPQMSDSSGNGRHGFIDNGELGRDPLITGDGRAMNVPNPGDSRGRWSGEGLPVAAPCTLEAWVKLDRDLLNTKSIIVAQRDTSVGNAVWLKVDSSVGSPNGELLIHFHGLGTGYKARGHTRVDDNEPHHVVCTIAGNTPADVLLYVDAELQTKTTVTAGNPGSWPSLLLWTIGNTIDNGVGDYGLKGVIDEPAIYPTVLTADRITAHYEAGASGFSGELTGARINRVLDIIGVPASLRDIAAGDVPAGPAVYGGKSAGSYINEVIESEQGFFHVDHRHGGKLKFRGRYSRLTDTRATTSQATFTDADAVGNLHYERDDLDVDPNAIASIVNIVDVTWRGGTVQAKDQPSVDAYGPQSRSIRTEAATPEAGLSAGNWVTNRYAQPQVRVRGFLLRPDADRQLWPAVLAAEVSDRITTVRHPQQVGVATTNLLTVEGMSHTVEGTHWRTKIRTSAAVLGDLAIWGTSTWDLTARWG